MPELPEVETVCRGLASAMTGRRIVRVTLNRPDLRIPFPPELQKTLTNATITGIERRAKYLLFMLDHGQILLAHLGMSGKMLVMQASDYTPKPHDHVLWELDNGQLFVFNDARRFGLMCLLGADEQEKHPLLAHLGPEPLSNHFSEAYLATALKGKKIELKQALMDQRLVVGVGNIYASEALFMCRLSPFIPAHKASKHAGLLISSIRSVLQAAIESGGSTLRDYVRSDGDLGYFQHHFQVYGREGKSCHICEQTVSRAVQAGRSTFFCQTCQKVNIVKPRGDNR